MLSLWANWLVTKFGLNSLGVTYDLYCMVPICKLFYFFSFFSNFCVCLLQAVTSRLSVSFCRMGPPCCNCQERRTDVGAWYKTPLRTFSQGSIARTALKKGHQSRSFHILSHSRHHIRFSHQFLNDSLLQGKELGVLFTVRRSFGISVSGSEKVQGVYVPTPTEKCYDLMEYIHDSVGLPWWLTILATTILFKGMIVFPFAVWQQMILARIENAQPLINAYVEQIKQQLAIIAKDERWSRRKMGKVFGQEVGNLGYLQCHLKHKDSFGKSENLSKIFFGEILVFDHDYEGKSSSSNGLLWISFIF